jgi:hypothetical protein
MEQNRWAVLRFIFRHCDVLYVRLISQASQDLHLELFSFPLHFRLLITLSKIRAVQSWFYYLTPLNVRDKDSSGGILSAFTNFRPTYSN